MTNLNSILEKIIEIQNQTIDRINKTNINFQLPSSIVRLDENNKIPAIYLNDCTAFEVFAHDYNIPVGQHEQLNDYINVTIPASKVSEFILCADEQDSIEHTDLIIDWGDGNIIDLKNNKDQNISFVWNESYNCWYITCQHAYEQNGKYIIKIYGTKYFRFQSSSDSTKNLICRVFDKDLPLAQHIRSFASSFKNCLHLTRVNAFYTNFVRQATNINSICSGCKNLISFLGFSNTVNHIITCQSAFAGCENLIETNFKIPLFMGGSIKSTFHNCKKLEMDLNDLIHTISFQVVEKISVEKLFLSCKKLFCNNINLFASKTWNNPNVSWQLPTETKYLPFAQCSNELRAQIPESWGGTASNDIIEQSIKSKFIQLQSNIENNNTILNTDIMSLSSAINNFKISGGIIPLNIKQVSGNTVELSNEYNCYKLTPSSNFELQFDNSLVKNYNGGEFYLMLDFTRGIYSINFPDTFAWKKGTEEPTINSKNLYIFKCTYLYTDPISYIGEFITSVNNQDYDKGAWSYDKQGIPNGVLKGIQYADNLILQLDAKTIINSGEFNIISVPFNYIENEYFVYEFVQRPQLIINGGIINDIIGFACYDGDLNEILENLWYDNWPDFNLIINGGLFNTLSVGESFNKMHAFVYADVKNATIQTIYNEHAGDSRYTNSTFTNCDILSCYNQYYWGSISCIQCNIEYFETRDTVPFNIKKCNIKKMNISSFAYSDLQQNIEDTVIETLILTGSDIIDIKNSIIKNMIIQAGGFIKINITGSSQILITTNRLIYEENIILNIAGTSKVNIPSKFKNNEYITLNIEDGAIVTYFDEEEIN